MEVTLSAPLQSSRRGTPLPLSQLVEDSRSRTNVPNHLLESKIYTKLKSNRLIQAEPAELHFSGFELQKESIKTLKITNISSGVLNVHIIPTQTQHFNTSYTKKHRLIPGLSYTLKVRFHPDEWRYYYDSVRVHCKGEENLLIPVHAYPVIDDLHVPTHIDLSAVPLGQSVCHTIPLRCSCPVDFEFQVFVLEPHEAFSISPLKGLIPANSEVKIIVTFHPLRYETCQVTIQLIVSQFNTKPYLCTIRGSSAPDVESLRSVGNGDALPTSCEKSSPAAQRKTKDKHLSGVRTHAGGAKKVTKSKSAEIRKGMLRQNLKELKTKQPRGELCGDVVPEETDSEKCTACRRDVSSSSQAQVAQKVVIRCQMNHRLSHPVTSLCRNNFITSGEDDDASLDAQMSSGRVFPSPFNIFCDDSDVLTLSDLNKLPVRTSDAPVTTCVPFFTPQAPQRYKLQGYQPLSAWEAFDSYIPSTFQRQLRSPDQDNDSPEEKLENEEDVVAWDEFSLDFSIPESFLQHPPGNPLQIFNPAPGLQNHKTFRYLESDLDFHLCPVPRYKTSHAEEDFLDHKFWSRAVRSIDSSPLKCVSQRSELRFPRRSVCFNPVLLPPPPLLTASPGGSCALVLKPSKVELTPEMVRAEFLSEMSSASGPQQVQ